MKRPPIIIRDQKGKDRVHELIRQLDPDKVWQVTVEPWVKKRSLDQNALMWKWFTIIADDTGDTKQSVHDDVVPDLVEPTGYMMHKGKPAPQWNTSKMNTAQMAELLNKLHAWAASTLGIALPLPEEMHRHD